MEIKENEVGNKQEAKYPGHFFIDCLHNLTWVVKDAVSRHNVTDFTVMEHVAFMMFNDIPNVYVSCWNDNVAALHSWIISIITPCTQPHWELLFIYIYICVCVCLCHLYGCIFIRVALAIFCVKGHDILLQAPYHVGLVQGLLPVVQLLLQKSFLFTEQLLQQDVMKYNTKVAITTISMYNVCYIS